MPAMNREARFPQWRRSARSAPMLAVLMLHAALLFAWMSSVAPRLRWPAPVEHRKPLVVRNVALLPLPPATPVLPRQEAIPARAALPAPALQPRRRTEPAATQPTATTTIPARAEPAAPVATPSEPAASTPLSLTLPRAAGSATMQGRGALTEPQSSMRQLALNDPRSNERVDPTQQLPNAVAAAGKGDCMKGEYLGAGMGLLSAPFLAYAAAAGHCKPQR
jgi:hypothetical protein